MNTQVIDLTSEESSSTQRLTSFEASTEAAAVTPDTSGDAALAERLARKESARAKPNGDAPDTSGDADLAAKLAGSGPADTSGDADLAAKLSGSGPADTSDDAALAARLAGQADRTAGDAAYAARLAARDARTEGDAVLARRLAARDARTEGDAALARRLAGADDAEGDAALARRLAGADDAKRRRVEPAPVAALASIRRLLGADPADLARPDEAVRLYPQPDGWSCGYRCLQTLVFALRRAGAEYGTALASAGLAEPGGVASVSAVQAAVERGWTRGFDPTGAQQTRDRLRGRFPFVGSREWIGCCEACVALRSAGVRADVRGFDGRRDGLAARRLVTYLADYFKNVVGVGSDDVWGASCLPPALVCFGGHNRCVVGVSRDRLVLLDPKWREPRLQCMAPADLARHARQWECLVVRPGVATRPLPTEPGDPA